MAQASPREVAAWVIDAGFTGLQRPAVIAVGIATGADPAADGGVFGVGGPAGDGAAQAVAAKAAVASGGLSALPAYRTGRHILYLPTAEAALAVVVASRVNPASGAAQAAQNAVDAITAPLRGLAYLSSTEAQERIGKAVVGLVLIGIGGFVFATSSARRITRRGLEQAERIGLTVLAVRGGAGGRAAPAPQPAPAPRPAAGGGGGGNSGGGGGGGGGGTPARRREHTTQRVSPRVAEARRILGEGEARRHGHAPYRGRAPRPAAKLVNPGGGKVSGGSS
jgi:hypothetical protein